ncbi:MAG: hypothetical protein ACI9QA_000534 [Methanobacteriota archaeon]|jgi:hypothetical protein|uniref:Uncharacterized protein n=1 Tax=Halorutilus salinus TaxID=2487751 RepID=A0A9Q4C7N8_9EURY|nr:hypothetical protein [Halorutilus salinus]MCX2819924.1 hypothetical protein [Halorutilus salinus]
MIGEEIRTNADAPIREPSKTAYLFLSVVVLLIWVGGSVVSSSLSV